MRDDLPDLIARLTARSIAWYITRNEHRTCYEPMSSYLSNQPIRYDETELSPEDLQRALDTDELVEVTAYPSTPVGFVVAAGPDIESAVRRLVEALEAEG